MSQQISSVMNPQLPQLKDTNVSSPSVVHRSESAQSITASESYYSLSSESGRTIPANDRSTHTIQRFQTPPSRYRTPLQSRDNLTDRHSPLRGQGQRRSSMDNETPGLIPASNRDSVIRRKPVPSTVLEGSESGAMSPDKARSSAALGLSREDSTTPDVDNKPFIRFAIDQLTRDEEVRGSRAYYGPSDDPGHGNAHASPTAPQAQLGADREILPVPEPVRVPPRNPNRPLSSASIIPESKPAPKPTVDVFLPLAADATRPLRFKPAILRPFAISAFLLLVLAYLALLLLAAVYSLRFIGLWDYGTIGDGRYFVFKYLPALLGMILLLWLFQLQIALTRIAPFLALSSFAPKNRLAGIDLPIYLGDFLLPKFRYFQARLPFVGLFMLVAWLQLFTIPLLASSFNVYYVQSAWRWTAVQGTVWAVVGLYVLLIMATILLTVDLARFTETGLRWDPRSLADLIAMLERSNALDGNLRNDPARLGLWRTSNRPNDAFHTYARANLEPRKYSIDGGRIREKVRESTETNSQWRHSNDAILGEEDSAIPSIAYPWYLRLSATLLWITIAFVLLLAFLIISYLPSTLVINGFLPALPVIVDRLGFGADNFVFAFVSTVLAMLCLLFWLDLDFAHRRYAPVVALLKPEGSLAEHSLLLSYTADYPFIVTLSAMANGQWRLAWIAFNTLVAAALPILAAGVFWAQFDVTTQKVRIYAHNSGFYALTALVTIYALSYFVLLPVSRTERRLARRGTNNYSSFADIIGLVRNSRILDDFPFHGPTSKVDLVTRLLSIQPGAKVEQSTSMPGAKISSIPEAGTSKLSLADSVRGFGHARQKANGAANTLAIPRYGLTRWTGRDGHEFWGIDRFR